MGDAVLASLGIESAHWKLLYHHFDDGSQYADFDAQPLHGLIQSGSSVTVDCTFFLLFLLCGDVARHAGVRPLSWASNLVAVARAAWEAMAGGQAMLEPDPRRDLLRLLGLDDNHVEVALRSSSPTYAAVLAESLSKLPAGKLKTYANFFKLRLQRYNKGTDAKKMELLDIIVKAMLADDQTFLECECRLVECRLV
jgi:hypothetical protein